MSDEDLLSAVADYYTGKLTQHGASPSGVDWNGAESQRLRFEKLLAIVADDGRPFTINDYGCGYGALLDELVARDLDFRYRGFDISTAMIEEARGRYAGEPRAERFTVAEDELGGADYTIASGIFNVRLDMLESRWRTYVLETIGRMAALSGRGIAFNALTAHSDPDRVRADLHYADPASLLDHCLRRHSRDVALRHDYELYEFTVLVRLDGRPPAKGSTAT